MFTFRQGSRVPLLLTQHPRIAAVLAEAASWRTVECMSVASTLQVTVPVRNEEKAIVSQLLRIRRSLDDAYVGRPQVGVLVVVNGSTDSTLDLAHETARSLSAVEVIESETPGKGAAVRHGWLASSADVVAYTDLDTSADLAQLPRLTTLIEHGVCDITVGSRRMPASHVTRSMRRRLSGALWSRTAALLTAPPVQDTACGLKAARRELVTDLLRNGEENQWAFDLELLVSAKRAGLRVGELAVTWVEDPESSIDLGAAGLEMLGAAWRLRRWAR